MGKRVLIIDDDADLCSLLARFLTKNDFITDQAYSGKEGFSLYTSNQYDAVICDYRLGDMDGLQIIKEIKAIDPAANIIVITGYSDVKTAVEVMRHGAADYISKPLIPEEVNDMLNNLLENNIEIEERRTNAENKSDGHTDVFKCQSPASLEIDEQVKLVARTDYSVIIYGESGTGKEVVARSIHNSSGRKNKPFVAVDCGTLSRQLATSELFGHIKGSFTGAEQDREGHFATAEGGTLFLDEVINLPLDVQALLLRVLQERKYKRVGSSTDHAADVRIIVASNEDLNEAYRRGSFREDLFHRFNEFSVHLPSLKERNEDIMPLAGFFLEQVCKETGKTINGFESNTEEILVQYPWPGNVRELRNVIRRAALLTKAGGQVRPASLPAELTGYYPPITITAGKEFILTQTGDKTALKKAAGKAEMDAILNVLKRVDFNKKKAAEILGIDRKTLYNKLKGYFANN